MDGPWQQCGSTRLHDPHVWDTPDGARVLCPGLDGTEHGAVE